MIFESVKHITDISEFSEKILIYIRMVEALAERNNIGIPIISNTSNDIIDELIDIGVINCGDDLILLEKIISNKYLRLLNCVGFYLKHKELFGVLLDKLNNTKRKKLQEKEIKLNKPSFVDFFAGAGGLSCGFVEAGYRASFANDNEKVCIETYRFNHPELASDKVLNGDIRKIVDNLDSYIIGPIDVVVGGPPCQGFSSANQQRIIDDPRNELYKYYINAVRKILPKFVVMENVKGMLKVAGQVIEDYENIKEQRNGINYTYSIAYRLLNSVDFSVAQNRERLIYIAVRNDVSLEKGVTAESIFHEIISDNKGKPHYLLNDALSYIKPLEAPRIKNMNEVDDAKTGKKIDYNLYEGNENKYLRLINSGRSIPYLFNHKARYVNDINYDIYRLLEQGDDATDPKIKDIMPYANRNHCFKDKYYKLIANRPSRTITAHLRMDCHSHIHPFQIRAITPREAARCQSFPDDYLFLGAYLKTYMQIGNAVPVLMAKEIANVIRRYI